MSRYKVQYVESNETHPKTIEILVSKVTITLILENHQTHWLLEEVEFQQQDQTLTILHPTEGQLIIHDSSLIQQLQKSYRLYKKMNWGIPVVYMSIFIKFLGFLSILGIVIWFFFRSVVPWMGEKAAETFPKEYELQLGDKLFSNMKQTLKIDSSKSIALQNFYSALGYSVDYPIKMHWVDEPIVNAFAVPGGNIVIYKGIIDKMQNAEELAALMGHEVSHVSFRHSLKGIFRNAANTMWWTILTGGDAGVVGIIGNQTDRLQQLSYSRNLESEADKNAVVLMNRANIDTRGMLQLVQLLKEEEGDRDAVNFLSTHPVSSIRIEDVKNFIKEYPNEITLQQTTLDSLFQTLKQSW